MISGIGGLQRIVETPRLLPEVGRSEAEMGSAFSQMVTHLATTTITRLEKAEALSLQGLKGEVDTREVVDAVLSAEQSLQAAISIRDKIVTAYLEISRMAI